MGYSTNSSSIPGLVGKGDLIVSDSLCHSSLALGCRLSGATIRVFQHNDMKDLEKKLREGIINGQPRTSRPWKRILILVEGLYSMEGDICDLQNIVALKKKYKAYLYVDEAHSIGSLGKSGKGVCDYWGVSPDDVDVLMGTFTKSFASAGGYIASTKQVIHHIRSTSSVGHYDSCMSPVCAQQILSALKIIRGDDGTNEGKEKIENLRRNSIYFRRRLKEKGFIVYGQEDSPVIPVIMFSPITITAFSRLCFQHNLAVVVVGYPATYFYYSRARFCLSANHKLKDLDHAIELLEVIGDRCLIRFLKNKAPTFPRLEDLSTPSTETTALTEDSKSKHLPHTNGKVHYLTPPEIPNPQQKGEDVDDARSRSQFIHVPN